MALRNCIEILQLQFLTVVREYESNYYTTDYCEDPRCRNSWKLELLNKQEWQVNIFTGRVLLLVRAGLLLFRFLWRFESKAWRVMLVCALRRGRPIRLHFLFWIVLLMGSRVILHAAGLPLFRFLWKTSGKRLLLVIKYKAVIFA